MVRAKAAYAFFTAGVTKILTYPGQELICKSLDADRAIRKAQKLGYNVRVYTSNGSEVRKAIKPTEKKK